VGKKLTEEWNWRIEGSECLRRTKIGGLPRVPSLQVNATNGVFGFGRDEYSCGGTPNEGFTEW